MGIASTLLSEFETQAAITRKFLERLPPDKLTWKPHEKSRSAGQLALHIAAVPGAVVRIVQQNPAQAPDFGTDPQPASREEILKTLDASIDSVRAALSKWDDPTMQEIWRMVAGEREVLALPRASFIRDIMLSHWYQHRGQFSVYLRLLDIPVPATWGPSADEAPRF